MKTRILTYSALALTLACGRIDLGSYGMGGTTSDADDEQADPTVSQRPPDVIIIGPVTSETTFEPANPVTERPGEEPPGYEQTYESGACGVGGVDAGTADAGAGVVRDAGAR